MTWEYMNQPRQTNLLFCIFYQYTFINWSKEVFRLWLMRKLVVLVIVLMMSKLGTSQLNNNNNSDNNTPIRLFCGINPVMSSSSNFLSSFNSTIAQLRSQLSNSDVYFARAQDLRNLDFVYGLAQCRNYLSTAQCVSCFDVAVSAIRSCSSVTGANVFLDNCFFRYENYPEFYDNPQANMDTRVAPTPICSNQSASQTTIFNQTVDELLSDIRIATPRTSTFYVASTRRVPSRNTTIYAIGQCIGSTSRSVCQNCLNIAYNNIYGCLPRTEGRTIDLGCYTRYSETPFFQDNQTTNITPFLSEGSSRRLGIVVGTSVVTVIVLIIFALSLWYKVWKKPKIQEDEQQFQGVKIYRYKDLQSATHNFREENIIGKGGYGEVFKAIIEDEKIVAVKKLHVGNGKAKAEFINEVKLISNIRHRNLMQLLGWSSDGPDLLLVLEYMPQGSLDKFLWGEERGTLNWNQRFEIMFGVARGLVHLHEELHVKIIHRDIKSNNILLDDDYQPKIADFGLARFQPEDRTHVSTRFAGTLGYTAPEYAAHGQLSEKVDTYSFGIVALEIISGRRGTAVNLDAHGNNYLLEHAWELYENGMHIELVDKALDPNEYEDEHVMKMIEIALMCTQSPATLRPTMSEVVLMLSSGSSLGQKQIIRPTFINFDRRIHVDAYAT